MTRKKPKSAQHLKQSDYGEHCKITTREPPADFQQRLIDGGAVPASVAGLWQVERVQTGTMVQGEME